MLVTPGSQRVKDLSDLTPKTLSLGYKRVNAFNWLS